jgi:cytoskeletal protein RodZ
MSQLGEQLRQAREAQGISLAQAAVETRILQQSLLALEEGSFHRLPGDVVTRGFIRNYAQYLGLPAEELIEIYRRERGESDKIRVIPAAHPPPRPSYALPSFLGVFFVTLALVGLTYVALNAFGRFNDSQDLAGRAGTVTEMPPTPTALATQTDVSTPVTTGIPDRFTPTPTLGSAGGIVTPAAGTPTTTPEAPIVVEVSIAADAGSASWLRVLTDDVTVFERIMQPGEREVFQANREFFIRAGNPPVVQVSVNGLQQGTLGIEEGIPVDWYWPPR